MNEERLQINNQEDYSKIVDIAKRADKEGLLVFDRFSLIMDLQVVHNTIGLRLDDLLNADNFNFAHDIIGIQNNMNRETKELENCFLPRYKRRV